MNNKILIERRVGVSLVGDRSHQNRSQTVQVCVQNAGLSELNYLFHAYFKTPLYKVECSVIFFWEK